MKNYFWTDRLMPIEDVMRDLPRANTLLSDEDPLWPSNLWGKQGTLIAYDIDSYMHSYAVMHIEMDCDLEHVNDTMLMVSVDNAIALYEEGRSRADYLDRGYKLQMFKALRCALAKPVITEAYIVAGSKSFTREGALHFGGRTITSVVNQVYCDLSQKMRDSR
jgi:hypothetical protein